jgi:ABC-2 type transport system permease protein
MSFLSNVRAVAYKEATIVRHDQALVGMVVAQPIIMLLLMGYALSYEPANVPWAVLDRDDSPLSRRFVQDVQATGYFLPWQRVASYDEGYAKLASGEVLAFVVVPEDFARNAHRGRPDLQVLLDGADPVSAARVGAYLGQMGQRFETTRAAPPRAGPGAGLVVRQEFRFNRTLDDSRFFLAALAGMLLTNLCMSATSLGLVAERENGTYEQMLAMPTRPLEIVIGKLVPYVGLSYVVLAIATFGSGLVFGLWPSGSVLALLAVTLPFVLGSLSVGVFVSAMARTSAQAVFITVFAILPSMVLSGVMFPYQLMPDGVREIGGVLPLRWYQIALRRITLRGAGIEEVIAPTLMLSAIFFVLLVLIRLRMKPRLA